MEVDIIQRWCLAHSQVNPRINLGAICWVFSDQKLAGYLTGICHKSTWSTSSRDLNSMPWIQPNIRFIDKSCWKSNKNQPPQKIFVKIDWILTENLPWNHQHWTKNQPKIESKICQKLKINSKSAIKLTKNWLKISQISAIKLIKIGRNSTQKSAIKSTKIGWKLTKNLP